MERRNIQFSPPDISEAEIEEVCEAPIRLDNNRTKDKGAGKETGGILPHR